MTSLDALSPEVEAARAARRQMATAQKALEAAQHALNVARNAFDAAQLSYQNQRIAVGQADTRLQERLRVVLEDLD